MDRPVIVVVAAHRRRQKSMDDHCNAGVCWSSLWCVQILLLITCSREFVRRYGKFHESTRTNAFPVLARFSISPSSLYILSTTVKSVVADLLEASFPSTESRSGSYSYSSMFVCDTSYRFDDSSRRDMYSARTVDHSLCRHRLCRLQETPEEQTDREYSVDDTPKQCWSNVTGKSASLQLDSTDD